MLETFDVEVRINPESLKNWPTSAMCEYDQSLMLCLKDRGAPIVGVFILKPDLDNYEWSFHIDHVFSHQVAASIYVYRWRKLTNEEKEIPY